MRNRILTTLAIGAAASVAALGSAPASARTFVSFGVGIPAYGYGGYGGYGYPGYGYPGYYAPPVAFGVGWGGGWRRPYWGGPGWGRGFYGRPGWGGGFYGRPGWRRGYYGGRGWRRW